MLRHAAREQDGWTLLVLPEEWSSRTVGVSAQWPCDWQYPQWLHGTVGSIRQGPPDSGSA